MAYTILRTQVESLAHILCWGDESGVDTVEMPRLALTFKMRHGAEPRLYCQDHADKSAESGLTNVPL